VARGNPIPGDARARSARAGVPKQSRRDHLPHYRQEWKAKESRISVSAVTGMDELLKVFAMRSAVYIGEYGFSFASSFDGNDLCATHVLAHVDGEPAGTMRIRWFGEFAKPERLAVLPAFRMRRFGARGVAHAIGKYAFDLCAKKGYRQVIGHSREELVRFWASFGTFVPIEGKAFVWNGSTTIPMIGTLAPPPDAITVDVEPTMLLKREGAWDRPHEHKSEVAS
jgi:hypothetical protein